MTAATDSQSPDTANELLGLWRRDRGFGLGPFGEKWWMAHLNRSTITPMNLNVEIPVIATGSQIIEVLEIQGANALYREYFVNPDGDLVKVDWVSQYEQIWTVKAGVLRGMLKRMKMAKAVSAQPAQKLHTAEIIPFPADRIVRRIEHGKPVDDHFVGDAA
jgi:hypothetical protein